MSETCGGCASRERYDGWFPSSFVVKGYLLTCPQGLRDSKDPACPSFKKGEK